MSRRLISFLRKYTMRSQHKGRLKRAFVKSNPRISDVLVYHPGFVELPPEKLSDTQEWPQMYKTFRKAIGADPDLAVDMLELEVDAMAERAAEANRIRKGQSPKVFRDAARGHSITIR